MSVRLLSLSLMFFCAIGAKSQKSQILLNAYNQHTLEQVVLLSRNVSPVPVAKDTFWSAIIPATMKSDYIRYGEKQKGKSWTSIPDELFAEYRENGNRANYEGRSFNIRRQFAALVLAEIMEHKGRFTADINRGFHYFINETWWGIPAHYPLDQPDTNNQVVDLFNAETACMLAWTIYMLKDELENHERGITEQIRKEIQRRFLTPALTINYDWKKCTSNWNPWICSNWLTCVLLCEDNREKQMNAISQILTCLDTFIDGNPDDGGCDEGVYYWDRAAGSLIESLILLDIATNGSLNLSQTTKIQAMGSFVSKMYIGNGKFVNFADSYETFLPHTNILFLAGWYLKNSTLLSFAAKIARDKNFLNHPSVLFNESGNYPTLGRELLFLSHFQDFVKQETAEPVTLSEWLPNLQVCSIQSDTNTSNLFLAAKGGHNDENHNHNDVGNFIVYKDSEPLIIDIGLGTYTAQTFSSKRYELFNCRSSYHNVPLINGIEQRDGKQYRSKNIKYSNKKRNATLSLDISGAYPKEACVDKWQRAIRLNRGKEVVVTENYKLSRYRQPSEVVLICCGEAHLLGNDKIVISNGKNQGALYFDNNQLTPQIEKIDYMDTAIQKSWQKRKLYRIRLTIRNQALKGKISYYIK